MYRVNWVDHFVAAFHEKKHIFSTPSQEDMMH